MQLEAENRLHNTQQSKLKLDNTVDERHGDYASNAAIVLAKSAKCAPRELAQEIIARLPDSDLFEKIEIAGAGFINFFVKPKVYLAVILDILERREYFGNAKSTVGEKVLLEFVSANPTGPLHIGHGRGAAFGATLANLLQTAGYDVDCEYYINDLGRQMDILAVSIWMRYLQQQEPELPFPTNGYQGDYIQAIAAQLIQQHGDKFISSTTPLMLLFDNTDSEAQIDQIIQYCIETLGEENYAIVFNAGLDVILNEIKQDLAAFGVHFDHWFSERSLLERNTINQCLETLKQNDWIYEQDGATWFRSSVLGDDKDRVLVRANGQTTYLASDVAYHLSKIERGYDKIINIWGADHHGYIARVKAAMQALGQAPEKLTVLLVQFATLYRGKERLPMSTRSGEFITLKTLQDEVGANAARFFYIMRKSEQHLDFDLELAQSRSNKNPVYYIQYAHARICSVFKQMDEKKYSYQQANDEQALLPLTELYEQKLMRRLGLFSDVIETAARAYEPHQLAYYLKDLANDFHAYYNASQFLVEDDKLRNARLSLIDATRQVIRNGLSILGVSALEKM